MRVVALVWNALLSSVPKGLHPPPHPCEWSTLPALKHSRFYYLSLRTALNYTNYISILQSQVGPCSRVVPNAGNSSESSKWFKNQREKKNAWIPAQIKESLACGPRSTYCFIFLKLSRWLQRAARDETRKFDAFFLQLDCKCLEGGSCSQNSAPSTVLHYRHSSEVSDLITCAGLSRPVHWNTILDIKQTHTIDRSLVLQELTR